MASREKNLVLNITGKTGDVENKFEGVTERAKQLGLTATKIFKKMSLDAKNASRTIAAITFTGPVAKLKTLQSETVDTTKGAKTTGAVTEDFDAQKQAKLRAAREAAAEQLRIEKRLTASLNATRKKRLTKFQQESRDKVQIANLEARALGEAMANGTEKQFTIRKANAVKLKKLEQQLQADLQKLATKFSKGTAQASTQRTKLLKAYRAETAQIHKTNAALAITNRKLRQNNDVHRHWIRHVTEIVGIYRLVNFGINTIIQSIKAIPEVGINLQTTEAVLESTLGSGIAVQEMFVLLNKEAERAGLSITSVRENFRNLNASMSLAGESTQTVLNVFRDLNTVSTTLHLSADKTQGLFLAIAQIFNKTKVQSEELVKQLGNLLPGAFASFAEAIGKSTLELVDEMKKGTVAAHENVELFADFLAGRFSAGFTIASQGLQANIQRMDTAFTHLGEAIFKFSKGGLIAATKAIVSFAEAMIKTIEVMEEYATVIQTTLVFSLVAVTGHFVAAALATAGITTAIGTATAASVLGARAVGALSTVLGFFSSPVGIIAGLAAIAFWIHKIASNSNAASNEVQSLLDAEKEHIALLAKMEQESEAFKLDLEILNLASIKNASKLVTDLSGEITDLEKKLSTQKFSLADLGTAESDRDLLTKKKQQLIDFKDFRLRLIADETAKVIKERKRQADAEEALNKTLAGLGKAKGSNAAATKAAQIERGYQQSLFRTQEILLQVQNRQEDLAKLRIDNRLAGIEAGFDLAEAAELEKSIEKRNFAKLEEIKLSRENLGFIRQELFAEQERLGIQRVLAANFKKQAQEFQIASIAANRAQVDFNRGLITRNEFLDKASESYSAIRDAQEKTLTLAKEELIRIDSIVDGTEDREAALLVILDIENQILDTLNRQADKVNRINDANQDRALNVIGGESVRNVETDILNEELGDIDKNATQRKIEADKQFQLDALIDLQTAQENYAASVVNIERDTTAKKLNSFGSYALGVMDLAADVASAQVTASIKAYGAESKQAKVAFAQYKAIMIAKTIMATALAVMNVWSTWAALPIVAGALTAIVVALGAVQIAQISGQQMPSAHGGLDYVPKEETYLLDRGERVLSPTQNRDLTGFLDGRNGQAAAQTNQAPVNVRIINSVDTDVFSDYLGSTEGEQIVENIIRRQAT